METPDHMIYGIINAIRFENSKAKVAATSSLKVMSSSLIDFILYSFMCSLVEVLLKDRPSLSIFGSVSCSSTSSFSSYSFFSLEGPPSFSTEFSSVGCCTRSDMGVEIMSGVLVEPGILCCLISPLYCIELRDDS